jgi:hypothetical protein
MPHPTITAAAIRAEIARRRIRHYQLAAAAGVAPTTLGAVLNERRPLEPDLAHRILIAIEDLGQRTGALQ